MPLERNPMIGETNATAIFRKATVHGKTLGYGPQQVIGADATTDQTMNVLIVPFDVIRRIAYMQAMNTSVDIRLFWVITEQPIEVHENDTFIVTEYGVTVTYTVQMSDTALYLEDTTVCICKQEK